MMYNNIKRKNIVVFILIVLALFVIIAFSIISKAYYIESKYKKAIALIDEAAYKEAKEQLEIIENEYYKDANDLIELCEAHISYNNGCCGVYMDIDDLDFEYQTKERKEAINEFIKKSKAEYDEFFQQLLEDNRKQVEELKKDPNSSFYSNKNQSNSSSTYTFTPYRSPSKDDDDDPYNAKDYSNEEDFYYDHYSIKIIAIVHILTETYLAIIIKVCLFTC